MAEPFLGQIRPFGFNFPPRGWAQCDGQLLPIAQNQSLYSLLGTTYGGDGRTTFALPDLRGRTPRHTGPGSRLGSAGGTETVALTGGQIPSHSHTVGVVSGAADSDEPGGHLPASTEASTYVTSPNPPTTAMAAEALPASGGTGQGHDNMQPYQVVNYCIAVQGLFPSRS